MNNLKVFSKTSNNNTRFLIAEFSEFSNPSHTIGHMKSCFELYFSYEESRWLYNQHSIEWAVIEMYGKNRFWKEESSEELFNIYKILLKAKQDGESYEDFPAHTITEKRCCDNYLITSYREGDIYINFQHLRMEEEGKKYVIKTTALAIENWGQENGTLTADVVTLDGRKVDTLYQVEGDYNLKSIKQFSFVGDNHIMYHDYLIY